MPAQPLATFFIAVFALGFVLSIAAQLILHVMLLTQVGKPGRFPAGAWPWSGNEYFTATGQRYQRAYRWALGVCLGSIAGMTLTAIATRALI